MEFSLSFRYTFWQRHGIGCASSNLIQVATGTAYAMSSGTMGIRYSMTRYNTMILHFVLLLDQTWARIQWKDVVFKGIPIVG